MGGKGDIPPDSVSRLPPYHLRDILCVSICMDKNSTLTVTVISTSLRDLLYETYVYPYLLQKNIGRGRGMFD